MDLVQMVMVAGWRDIREQYAYGWNLAREMRLSSKGMQYARDLRETGKYASKFLEQHEEAERLGILGGIGLFLYNILSSKTAKHFSPEHTD